VTRILMKIERMIRVTPGFSHRIAQKNTERSQRTVL
jgi:hypothetical protein